MKRLLLSLSLCILTVAIMAQSPEKFSYQAVSRDAAGDPVVSSVIGLRISIHTGSAIGPIAFQETHAPSSNEFGLINITIGEGTPVTGTIGSVSWDSGTYWLQVEQDITGGTSYVDMGATQLLSVPYALYSKSTLDGSYDGISGAGDGREITVDSGPVLFSATGFIALHIDAASGKNGIDIDGIDGTGFSGTAGVDVSAISSADAFYGDVSGDGQGLSIDHDGAGDGVYIFHEGAGDGVRVDKDIAGSGNSYYADHDADSDAVFIDHSGDGDGIRVDHAAGKTGNSVYLSHDGTEEALLIDNDGTSDGLRINHNSGLTGAYIEHYTGGYGLLVDVPDVPAASTLGFAAGLHITKATSTGTNLEAINLGLGTTAEFSQLNAGNASTVVEIFASGTGNGLDVGHVGDGISGNFLNTSPAPTGKFMNLGTGPAGVFENTGPGTTLFSVNLGDGPAGEFHNMAPAPGGGPALIISNTHSSPTMEAFNLGDGPTAVIKQMGPASFAPALDVEHSSEGSVAFFHNTPVGLADAVIIDNSGSGKALAVVHSGATGHGISVVSLDPTNPSPAVSILNGGGTEGIYVENTDAANEEPVIYSKRTSAGDNGYFVTDFPGGTDNSVYGDTNGLGNAVRAKNTGSGRAITATNGSSADYTAFIEKEGAFATEDAVHIRIDSPLDDVYGLAVNNIADGWAAFFGGKTMFGLDAQFNSSVNIDGHLTIGGDFSVAGDFTVGGTSTFSDMDAGDLTADDVVADSSCFSTLKVGTAAIPTGYIASIDGKMACEELLIDLSGDWPDYVFEDSYQLRSLSEVEKYISDKGHLPGVPSAMEIQDKGLEVGEMQKILLEKIEELTLYVIDLKKENEQLKVDLESLK